MSSSKSSPSVPETDASLDIRLRIPLRFHRLLTRERAAVVLLGFLILHPPAAGDQHAVTGRAASHQLAALTLESPHSQSRAESVSSATAGGEENLPAPANDLLLLLLALSSTGLPGKAAAPE